MARFEAAHSELLAVTDPETGAILGQLGEAHATRRYAQEADRAAKGVFGG